MMRRGRVMSERPRILVVDDDPVNLQVIASALKNEYDIFTVLNGYDAISQLRKHTPDLILLDVMMPELTGFDLCAIIKSDTAFAEIPVILKPFYLRNRYSCYLLRVFAYTGNKP